MCEYAQTDALYTKGKQYNASYGLFKQMGQIDESSS